MFMMTYNEAIKKQAEQAKFYDRLLSSTKRAELVKMTKPCPFDPDEMRPVIEINQLVPRGRDIERLCGLGE